MGRTRTGSVKKTGDHWIVRVNYKGADGKRHHVRRRAESHTEGERLRKQILRELERQEDRGSLGAHDIVSFVDLADWYEKTHAVDPVYRDGHKMAGLRGKRTVLYRLKLLRKYFGTRNIRTITYGQIEAYKLDRLKQVNPRGEPIKLASVHRELALLRRLLNLAVREFGLPRNPFNDDAPLIVKSHERGRTRTLTLSEENRLLSVCEGERAHLRPIVICALDTGLRPGELFSLTWNDVNLQERTITVQAMNTKTLTRRVVPISSRLLRELRTLRGFEVDTTARVFGIQRSIAKAWKTVCRLADLPNLRFYDLRHTFDSRLMEEGLNPMVVSRLMGHAAPKPGAGLDMTYHYTHPGTKTQTNVVSALDAIERARLKSTGHK